MIRAKVVHVGWKPEVYFPKESKAVQREFRREIKSSAMAIMVAYKRKGRKHFITGVFDESIVMDSPDGWWTAEVGSTVLHSIFLEVGTKAHPIFANEADYLVFFLEKAGVWVSKTSVSHPGTPAFNLLLKSWIEIMEPFQRQFAARLITRLNQLVVS